MLPDSRCVPRTWATAWKCASGTTATAFPRPYVPSSLSPFSPLNRPALARAWGCRSAGILWCKNTRGRSRSRPRSASIASLLSRCRDRPLRCGARGAPMHILVVDDERDVQLLFEQHFRRELRAAQLALHFAFSGEAALETLKRPVPCPIVLILTDINMPGMSGLDLLKRIKACYAHLKVFLLTAYSDASTYATAMHYGADAYLTKPIDFAALKQ